MPEHRRRGSSRMMLGAAVASTVLLGFALVPSAQAAPAEPSGAKAGEVNIIASHSGMCLEVVGGSSAAGAAVAQADCTGQAGVLWRLEQSAAGGGSVNIVNANSSRCIEVQGTAVGSPVKQADCSGQPSVSFRTVDKGTHVWLQPMSASPAKCLEVPAGSHLGGAELRLAECSGQSGTGFRQRLPKTGNDPAELPDNGVERVNVTAAGGQIAAGIDGGWSGSVSEDGRYVAFDTMNGSVVAGDTNAKHDIFVRDRITQTAERISVSTSGAQANGDSNNAKITADGRYVAFFSSASNLVSGDTNNAEDVFVRDRKTGITERVSRSTSGQQGTDKSGMPFISADGRYVAFSSHAPNMVSGDTNGLPDTFVHDRQTGVTERVSVSTSGAQGNQASFGGSITPDGRYVVFPSWASNLTPGSTSPMPSSNVFVRDRQTNETELITVSNAGKQTSGSSGLPTISADGRYVAFNSSSADLLGVGIDTNNVQDSFVRDRQTQTTKRINVNANGTQSTGASDDAAISADGRRVAFTSAGTQLVSGDTNAVDDVFVRDLQTGATTRASVNAQGDQANGASELETMSYDGRHLVFNSAATNLITGDTNAAYDLFVRQRPGV